jgi:tubulin polyglutamylase TTLL6/13
VNHSPSFHTDSKLDREVKEALIHDVVCLINFDAVDRKTWLEEERKRIQQRLITVRNANKDGVKDSKYKAKLQYGLVRFFL